jgi:hypothetical protein
MPVGVRGLEHDDSDAEHDGHIRNIEDSSPQWTNPHAHEIDNRSVNDSIQEIGNATACEQRHTEKSPRGPASPQRDDKKEKDERVPSAEDRCSDRTWPVPTEGQEATGILGVLKTKRVGEE